MRKVLITGTAGFIGYHLAQRLLRDGFIVHGYDALTDYYDVTLKQARHKRLASTNAFTSTIARLEEKERLLRVSEDFAPDVIVHLAAQAGVRYSLENPQSYIESNVVGTFNVLECARLAKTSHLILSSTSSVYGGNTRMPFREIDKADMPLTIYAATKKAGEEIAHSYAHLWGIPVTAVRFFTVYGPWGRPDMALFKFTRAMLEGSPVEIYNGGDLYRDFTYVDDLVEAIRRLIDVPPRKGEPISDIDSLSGVAPFRAVNIGNADKIRLLDFVDALEEALGVTAKRHFMEMQKGDVFATWADNSLLRELTGFTPAVDYKTGVAHFARWYHDYYRS